MIFNKVAKTIQWKNNCFFQQTVLGQLDSPEQKNGIRTLPYVIYKN